ncbi:hypothetical protein BDV12DRAFT_179959 [Aspergillus spectabilis]
MTPAGLLTEEQPSGDSTFSWLAGSFAQDTPCAAAVSSPVPPPTVTSRDSDSDASNACNQGLGLTSEFPACCQAKLMVGFPETMDTGLAYQHCMFRVYFEGPNTHYPCIDEADFISRFEALAQLGRKVPYTSETLQMLALVNMILAVVRALEGEGSPHEEYPGWSEYRRGNHFLRHVLWSGQLDLLMVQSLVLKSSYLLYIEQPHLAYDALSVATRVIYQMGLHKESRWADTNQSEIVVYRRVLWSCYCLDRVVAVACGGPYHLQDADMTVGEPSAADDWQTSTTAGPVAGDEGSPTPSAYLRELVHWARLGECAADPFCLAARDPGAVASTNQSVPGALALSPPQPSADLHPARVRPEAQVLEPDRGGVREHCGGHDRGSHGDPGVGVWGIGEIHEYLVCRGSAARVDRGSAGGRHGDAVVCGGGEGVCQGG